MVCGVILAAGVSSRMGSFKAMLPIGDTTFIRRMIRVMREAGVQEIIVITGFRRKELRAHIRDLNVRCVHNARFYGNEMLDSVKLGLKSLPEECERVILSPVDAAMPQTEIYEKLLASEGDFIVPVFGKAQGHPVVISRELFSFILQYIGEGGLRGAVSRSGVRQTNVEVDDPNVTMDVDTPEDYRKLLYDFDQATGNWGRLHGEFKISLATDEVICGNGFIQLMELVENTGSLQRAAWAMHISYTKVWKMLKYVESKTSVPLMIREAGGEAGGGSMLTPQGKELLRRYKAMRKETEASAQKIFEKYFCDFRI